MKVMYVITRGDTIAGAQRNVLDLATAAHEVAEVVVCASSPDGPLAAALHARSIPFEPIDDLAPGRGARGLWAASRHLARAIGRHRPDVIHAHSSTAGLLARLLARRRAIPCVFTAHGWSFVSGAPWLRRVGGLAIELVGGRLGADVIVVSTHDLDVARRLRITDPGHLHQIECGIPERAPTSTRPPSTSPALLMTARFERQKDHACLLRALADLTDLPWTLTLAGDGPLFDATRTLARDLDIDQRVRFLGFVRDMDAVVDDASLFVLASHYEGLPISIMEALRAGLPVVASDVGGVAEAVQPGVNGHLVPAGDPDALAAALRAMLTGTPDWQDAGRESRRIYERSFTLERMVDRTFALYGQVTGVPITAG